MIAVEQGGGREMGSCGGDLVGCVRLFGLDLEATSKGERKRSSDEIIER